MNKKGIIAFGLLALAATGVGLYFLNKKKYTEQPVGLTNEEKTDWNETNSASDAFVANKPDLTVKDCIKSDEEATLEALKTKVADYVSKAGESYAVPTEELKEARKKAHEALNKPPLVETPAPEPVEEKPTGIQLISPDEIDYEDDAWEVITLSWFSDGIMLDDEGQRMPEYFEAVGTDFMHHFVDGTAAVKNWDRQIYYEILDEGCPFGDDDLEES